MLANVYLHYVFDLWTHQWRQRGTRGEVLVVRYCDDFIVTFQYKSDAERYLRELKERFQKFKLELHPEKTRLIEFGRFAIDNYKKRGGGKPETFNFLGFTHMCGAKKSGTFVVLRQTEKKRLRAKVTSLKLELQRRKHFPLLHQCRWLKSVVTGHFNYYGVPTNLRALNTFRFRVIGFWMKALRDRSQNDHFTWERMYAGAGYLGVISLIPIRLCALASRPKVGAGCGNPASPDLCGVERGNPLPYRDRHSIGSQHSFRK